MYLRFPQIFMACVLAVVATCVRADVVSDFLSDYQTATSEGKKTHIVDIDNDSLMFDRADGFYTSGLRYTRYFLLKKADGAVAAGWRIGQELYTASDINLPADQIGPPDHPYAGWLYGGFFNEVFNANGTYSKIGIDIGCLGPCAAGEWTQKNLHRLLRQPLPQGWDKQVKNELGGVLYGEMIPVRWTLGSFTDIAPRFKGRFGNIFTDIDAGVMARAGRLNMLPDQPAWYAFLRADARAVGYDATLQGGYFSKNNPHVVEPKRWVGEAEVGMAWNDGPYGLRLSLVRNGNEIRDLPNSLGMQNFIRLQFSYVP